MTDCQTSDGVLDASPYKVCDSSRAPWLLHNIGLDDVLLVSLSLYHERTPFYMSLSTSGIYNRMFRDLGQEPMLDVLVCVYWGQVKLSCVTFVMTILIDCKENKDGVSQYNDNKDTSWGL